ncbi:MAG: PqqD family protein [Bacteroidaceae bacterium]|jgi:hypothetical protein|nr:PqqD family protein [Bacteroidaceae bacterium]
MKLKEGFALHDVCGEKVLIAEGIENINFSKMINLNPSAAFLWEEASKGEFTAESLAELLTKEYEVEYVQALCDTTVLVEQWKEHGLIEC